MLAARRMMTALLFAAAFGVLAGAFKGNNAGIRGAIGNMSAPWLLVAALPALRCRTALQGAVVGLLSTLVALAGFYATLTVVLAGHLGGDGYLRELTVELGANRIYLLAGFVTGPLLGATGAWSRDDTLTQCCSSLARWSRVRSSEWPYFKATGSCHPRCTSRGVSMTGRPIGESLVGVGIVAVALWRRRRRAPAP